MMPPWIDYLFFHNWMPILATLSLIGLWRLSRRSPLGLVVVVLHFMVAYALLEETQAHIYTNKPIQEAMWLWCLAMSLGWGWLLVELAPYSRRFFLQCVRAVYWQFRWLREHPLRAIALAKAAKSLGIDDGSHQLSWEQEDGNSIEISYGKEQGVGHTSWKYQSQEQLPLTLSLTMPAQTIPPAPPATGWLEAFAITPHWQPFTAIRSDYPRPFGVLKDNLLVAGIEQDVLALFGPDTRALLASFPPGMKIILDEGELYAQQEGFDYDDLAATARKLLALGRALSQEVTASQLHANLQAETEPRLQIRLLEYLLGRYVRTPAAKVAYAWAKSQKNPALTLLCAITDAAAGIATLRALVLAPTLEPVLRQRAWDALWQVAPEDEAIALLQVLLAEPTAPLCAAFVTTTATRPSQRTSALICAWFSSLPSPRDEACVQALLSHYKVSPDEDIEACALQLLQPDAHAVAEVLQVAEQMGNAKTITRLHIRARELKQKENASFDEKELHATIERSIAFLRSRVELDEHGQLSLAAPEEGAGSLSLAHEAEIAGGLSLGKRAEGGGLSLRPDTEGHASIAEEPS